jgi:hypothetical protein
MAMMECTDLRIGTSVATLQYLRHRGIEEPDVWTYVPYSVQRVTGTGEVKSYGYPGATWTWERLDQASLSVLLAFFSAATDASVQVYISTYTDTGRRRTTTDYTAYMLRPLDGEGKLMYPGSAGKVSENVTIAFTHLEAA